MAPKRRAAQIIPSGSEDETPRFEEQLGEVQGETSSPQRKKQKKAPPMSREERKAIRFKMVAPMPESIKRLKTPGAMTVLKNAQLEAFASLFPRSEDADGVTQLIKNYNPDQHSSKVTTPDGVSHEISLSVEAISRALQLPGDGYCPNRGESIHHMNRAYFVEPDANNKTNDGYYIKNLKSSDLRTATAFVQKTLEMNSTRPHLVHSTPLRMLTKHLDKSHSSEAEEPKINPEINWARFVYEELREKLLFRPKSKITAGPLLTQLIQSQTQWVGQSSGAQWDSPRSEEATTQRGEESINILEESSHQAQAQQENTPLQQAEITSEGEPVRQVPETVTPATVTPPQTQPILEGQQAVEHTAETRDMDAPPQPELLPEEEPAQERQVEMRDRPQPSQTVQDPTNQGGREEAGVATETQNTFTLATQAVHMLIKVAEAARLDQQMLVEADLVSTHMEDYYNQLIQAREELGECKLALQSTQQSLSAAENQLGPLQQDRAELEEQRSARQVAEQRLIETDSQLAQANNELAEHKVAQQSAEECLEEHKTALTTVRQNLSKAEDQISTLQKDNSALNKKYEDHAKKLTTFRKKVTSLKAELKESSEALAVAEKNTEAQVVYASRITSEIAELKEDRELVEIKMASLESARAKLSTAYAILEVGLEESTTQNTLLKDTIQKLQEEYNAENKQLKETMQRMREECERQRSELEHLKMLETNPELATSSEGAGLANVPNALVRAIRAKETYKKSYLDLKDNFNRMKAQTRKEVDTLQVDHQGTLDMLAERQATLETSTQGLQQTLTLFNKLSKFNILPLDVFEGFFIIFHSLKIKLISVDFFWPDDCDLEFLELLYSRSEEEERNILCLAYALGYLSAQSHQDFCAIFPFLPLRVCAGYVSILSQIAHSHQNVREFSKCTPIKFPALHPPINPLSEDESNLFNEKKFDVEPTLQAVEENLLPAITFLRTVHGAQKYFPPGLALLFAHGLQHFRKCIEEKKSLPFEEQDLSWPADCTPAQLEDIAAFLPFNVSLLDPSNPTSVEAGTSTGTGTKTSKDAAHSEYQVRTEPRKSLFSSLIRSPPHSRVSSPEEKSPSRPSNMIEEEIQEFEQRYPVEMRGGWDEFPMPINDPLPSSGPQPKWREGCLQDRITFVTYAQAPRRIRTHPKFNPIPRRDVWLPSVHKELSTMPINWPIIIPHNSSKWQNPSSMVSFFKKFYDRFQKDIDPVVWEAAQNCQLMVTLLEMPVSYDSCLGSLTFNPNFRLPLGTINRLYYRVQTLSSANVFRFEQWVRTGWIVSAPPVFGPIKATSLDRQQSQERWHREVTIKRRESREFTRNLQGT